MLVRLIQLPLRIHEHQIVRYDSVLFTSSCKPSPLMNVILECERSAEPPKNVGNTAATLLIASWDELRVAWASPTFFKCEAFFR